MANTRNQKKKTSNSKASSASKGIKSAPKEAPKKEVPKVYYARHEGTAGEADIAAFAAGLTLRDGLNCLSAKLEPLGPGESLITVCEGKYHQVRRMMASRGMTVVYLQRRKEGPLELGNLPKGAVRELSEEEVALLDL